MKKNTLIALGVFAVLALILLAFVPPPASVLQKETPETLLWVFEGVTPCADCAGIRTRLTLMQDAPYRAEGTYELSLTYIGEDVEPVVQQGLWTTERGTAYDPDATVYALDPDIEGQTTRYVRLNATTIRALDGDGNAIPDALPFNLELIQAGPEQGAMPEVQTLTGMRTCVPHKNTGGVQTQECLSGLVTDDGANYALDFGSMPGDSIPEGRVSVTGMVVPVALLSSDQWQTYDVAGVVSVEAISAI